MHVIGQLKSNKAVTSLKSPDFLHFSVSGLRDVASTHARDSAQVSDALKLTAALVDKVSGSRLKSLEWQTYQILMLRNAYL